MSEHKTIVNIITGEIISGAITSHPFSKTDQFAEIVKCRDGIYRYIDEVSESDRWNREEAQNLDKIAELYADGADLHSHGSEPQQIAAAWVKQRGTSHPLALIEEAAFINGYLIAKQEK